MQGPFQSKPVLLVDSTRKCVLDLFIHRIFGREDKSFCSQGNIRAAITANSLWSILVGRGPFCVVLFRKSKQKLSAIHFRMRMMKSPATSTEQIRMRTSILHIRMEEIHAGNGGIKLSAMKKKKKIGEENSSLLKKIQCSALCQRINFLNVKHYWFWFCCSYLREKSFSW